MQTLRNGATLQNEKYRITQLLGQGGFGITYLAEQPMLGRQVAIKEFFISTFCKRDERTSSVSVGTQGSRVTVHQYREKFIKEAQKLAMLSHPHIIRIFDVFEENGTAYYVMEFATRGSLADMISAHGPMPENLATRYIMQIAQALDYIHQHNINHLDIKPANVMLNDNGDALLIDFGLSKQYDGMGSQTSTTPVGISEGFAPMEQYRQAGVQGFSPETDIYALGATFFKLLTGETPPSATEIFESGVPVNKLQSRGVSQMAIQAITAAMQPQRRMRLNSAKAFIQMLSQQQEPPTSAPAAPPRPDFPQQLNNETTRIIQTNNGNNQQTRTSVTQPTARKNNSSNFTYILIACIAAVCVSVGILTYTILSHKTVVVPNPTTTTQNTTTPVTPTTTTQTTTPTAEATTTTTTTTTSTPPPASPEPAVTHPSAARCTVGGNIPGYGYYSLVFQGSDGLISPGVAGKEGYLGDVSYNPSDGSISAVAYTESYQQVGYYRGTLTVENGQFVFRGSFSNNSGKYAQFTMRGN